MDFASNVLQYAEEIQILINQNNLNDLVCLNSNGAFIFPISNEVYLDALETRLKSDPNYRIKLIQCISFYSGTRLVHLIKWIMTALFEDHVLTNYSYTGKGIVKKKCFSDLEINTVIISAVNLQKVHDVCPYEIEKQIKAYLTQVPYRLYHKANKTTDEK